jgi:hypothetical protein
MQGHYDMVADDGTEFAAPVARSCWPSAYPALTGGRTMSVWAIGDLQGCYDVTQRLLEKIRFDPAQDTCGSAATWSTGAVAGNAAAGALLREHSVVVLGNHDLSLLAVGSRTEEEQRKVNRTCCASCRPRTATNCWTGCGRRSWCTWTASWAG